MPKVKNPDQQLKRIAKGAPTKGSGSDTSPYSSAKKGSKRAAQPTKGK